LETSLCSHSLALVLTTKPQQPRDRTRTKHKPMQYKKWPY